ncbi:hypothetical protein GCM10010441_38210 [Kitasatospora paracochleata]|uniref:oxygenase MpaB family protein n=1 Tax=Kitasatospora paracochleata TaxID=58354 RepID=UPI0031CE1A6D
MDAFGRLVLEELPQAARVGLTLGFVRTFGVPEIAAVLHGTGALLDAPKARAKATGATMFALIGQGVDSPEGRRLVGHLRTVHERPGITDELMAYVLACFTLGPVRFLDVYGRRPVTGQERAAAYGFHAALGDALGLPANGADLAEVGAWTEAFEARRFGPSPQGRALWASTSGLLASRLPRPLARLAPLVTAALLDGPLRRTLGVDRPPAPVRALVRAGLRRLR